MTGMRGARVGGVRRRTAMSRGIICAGIGVGLEERVVQVPAKISNKAVPLHQVKSKSRSQ